MRVQGEKALKISLIKDHNAIYSYVEQSQRVVYDQARWLTISGRIEYNSGIHKNGPCFLIFLV